MTVDAQKALQFETEFLSGVDANFELAKGRQFRGSIWQRTRDDDSDQLRALMASKQVYDRELLKSLPANRRLVLLGFERRWGLWKSKTGVAIASVLSPMGHYVSPGGQPAPPINLGEVMDHLRKLVRNTDVPHIIGVCSPTGFTEEARTARIDMANVTVVLVEPDDQGGWRSYGGDAGVDPRLVKIFDPEGPKQKVERVRRIIEDSGVDLLTGGLSTSAVARRANVPEAIVRHSFEAIAASDPELRIMREEGELVMFRGAPARSQERRMSVIDRIRQLFSGEGDETEKINLLAERRAALARRRERLYEDIAKLEDREQELLGEGKAAHVSKAHVKERRLAAQLAQLRNDIARQNTTAGMLNQQINIISTDIHNLTLLQQGQMAQLPNTEQLTEHAVAAEEMLETLRADADLVAGLETGIEANVTNAEEQAILREFGEVDGEAAPAKTAEPRKATSVTKMTPPAVKQPLASKEPPTRQSAPDEPSGSDKLKDRGRDAEAL